MRKRSGRPPRFAAVPNETVDDAASLDLMALGLLTVFLRHQDGWEIRLADVGERYGYGRDALARAMGLLQVARYVVKIRVMAEETRQWSTELLVYDTPATDQEIDATLKATERDPEVRAVQLIEPTSAALEHVAERQKKLDSKRRRGPGVTMAAPDASPDADAPTAHQELAAETSPPPRPARAGKTGKPKKAGPGVRLSKKQAADLRTVEEAFPEQVRALLPKYRPDVLRDAALEALEFRSAEQLAERVRRRWWSHGYEAATMPGGKGLGSPVGVAVALVRPSTDCPDPFCEDGVRLTTGEPCPKCAERKKDRRGVHGGVPEQRSDSGEDAPVRWECRECHQPHKGARPRSGLCSSCRADAEEEAAAARSLAALAAEVEARRAESAAQAWDTLLAEAYAEQEAREQRAAEQRVVQEEAERKRLADQAETRRIREQLAREHPELAAYAQA